MVEEKHFVSLREALQIPLALQTYLLEYTITIDFPLVFNEEAQMNSITNEMMLS